MTNSLEKLYRLETVLADRKQAVGVLSTDMSKAFDSLYPSLLLEKPEAYGVSHNSVALLHSYLNDRKNRVKIGNTTSEWNTCNCGCPQGSALGPALWNSNQNDLFYESIRSQLSSYADDHQLYINGNNVGDVIQTLQRDGKTIGDWYKANHLEGNIPKYRVMVLGNTSETSSAIEIDNVTIKRESPIQLLGVTLDEGLNFSGHISQICAKTSRRINVIVRLRKLIPLQAKLQIHKSAVLPYFNYCSLIWHFCKAGDRDTLERINERGLRAVFCEWRASYGELLSRAHMTTLLNSRLQNIAIFMYKIKNKLLPVNILEIFPGATTSYKLRNNDFFIPR